jgi:hypothetical protein
MLTPTPRDLLPARWPDRAAPVGSAAQFLSRARTKGNHVKRSMLSLSVSALLALAAAPALADTLSGEVTKIDRYSESIEVKGGAPARKKLFFLTRDAQVLRAGQPVALRDVKRGDRVEVEFSRQGGTPTASRVTVLAEAGRTVASE